MYNRVRVAVFLSTVLYTLYPFILFLFFEASWQYFHFEIHVYYKFILAKEIHPRQFFYDLYNKVLPLKDK